MKAEIFYTYSNNCSTRTLCLSIGKREKAESIEKFYQVHIENCNFCTVINIILTRWLIFKAGYMAKSELFWAKFKFLNSQTHQMPDNIKSQDSKFLFMLSTHELIGVLRNENQSVK